MIDVSPEAKTVFRDAMIAAKADYAAMLAKHEAELEQSGVCRESHEYLLSTGYEFIHYNEFSRMSVYKNDLGETVQLRVL